MGVWINTGGLSSTKTVCSVMLAVEEKKPIVSNLELTIPYTKMTDQEFVVLMDNVMKMAESEREEKLISIFKDKIWLVDEGEFLFDARKFGSYIADLGTAFCRQLGKIDADLIINVHVMDSDVDKRIRSICNVHGVCSRRYEDGSEVFWQKRRIDHKIMSKIDLTFYLTDGIQTGSMIFDPEPYYKYYRTEQMIFLNRNIIGKK